MRSDYWNDKSILIIGASSDLCSAMIPVFVESMAKIGLHYNKNREALGVYEKKDNVRLYQQDFFEDSDFERIFADFCAWAGGINYLIIMTGNCINPVNWRKLNVNDVERDYYINAVVPFMLAKNAIKHMTDSTSREISATNGMEAGCMRGGTLDERIIFTGTASAQNAGGSNSLSYGAAKLALECMMKRMAKDSAKDNILINMVCPGFIRSKFQTQVMKRSDEEICRRAEYVPLKRSGTYEEVAEAYFYLLSENTTFVTGEVLNVKGGDWI